MRIDPGDGFFLHAAGILCDHGVILLMGHSGSGKSTLSKMMSDYFAVLRDDRVFLRLEKGRKWVVDLKQGQEMPCSTNHVDNPYSHTRFGRTGCVPLFSVIRVFGAQDHEIILLSPAKTCEYLMDATFEIDHQRRSRNIIIEQKWFACNADIARRHSGYLLRFSLKKEGILDCFTKVTSLGGEQHFN